MPNGGSDCCGSCWFNARNKGKAGHAHHDETEPAACTIRDLPIGDPFYTYCCNHPHRRPEPDPVPIGPVYTGSGFGPWEVWRASPDTEAIRRHLLRLLTGIEEPPAAEYPIGARVDEVVVWQLGEFREPRALESLRRLAAFDPTVTEPGPFGHTRAALVQLAREALTKIEPAAP